MTRAQCKPVGEGGGFIRGNGWAEIRITGVPLPFPVSLVKGEKAAACGILDSDVKNAQPVVDRCLSVRTGITAVITENRESCFIAGRVGVFFGRRWLVKTAVS